MKTFFIETFGCQMNEYDSELIAAILSGSGLQPAPLRDNADIVLVNACSVRDHAEQRVIGRLGELKRLKYRNRDVIIGLCGCMAQRWGQKISEKVPHLDLVVGPDAYRQLPGMLEAMNGQLHAAVTLDPEETYSNIHPVRNGDVSAWVAIMRGCDNYCAYCIVPYVRGPARSRPMKDVSEEVESLVKDGFREVTLLGQNVNAYSWNSAGFATLLRTLDRLDGLDRIRFTTSHPKDMTLDIIDSIAGGRAICEHIHLPVQSGSDRILNRMNRGYSVRDYLGLVSSIRERIPDVSITTDIIAGFPGETEDDFQATQDLVAEVRFDSAFTFRYSPRAGTRADTFVDDVPENVKIRRLETLIDTQRNITDEKNKSYIGSSLEVLIEGLNQKGDGKYIGKTRTAKTVVFDGEDVPVGSLVQVRIQAARGWTLWGEILDTDS